MIFLQLVFLYKYMLSTSICLASAYGDTFVRSVLWRRDREDNEERIVQTVAYTVFQALASTSFPQQRLLNYVLV